MAVGSRPSASFGEVLRRQREAAGLSQEHLAERAGLTERGLRYLERDLRRPYPDTVRRLAAALALTSEERAAFARAARAPAEAVPAPALGDPEAGDLPPLVGRDRELALLGRHLAGSPERSPPPVLLLAGEPGIGKTRLLCEAAERAGGAGWTVLQGGCQRRAGQEPYAPVLEALERHIRTQPPAVRRDALRGCAWLVRLLPELAGGPIEPLPTWTVPAEQERRLVFRAVQRYLANVAGPAGTLLLLDDLQWAGVDALDLLVALARVAGEAPLRLVGAYRDTEAPPDGPLAAALAALAEAELAAQRALAPLSAAEVGQLLDQLAPEVDGASSGLRERVAQRTGGVPFFVISCAQALRLEGGDPQGAEAVPWTVAQSVRQRAAALSTQAQGVLAVAAVLGRVARPALVAAVAARSEDDVLAALEAARRLRLLEEREGAYQFAHDLVREVVEADVGRARRLVLHRRAGEALEAATGEPPVELLAYHFARSDAQDKALVYLERAGDRAEAQFAHASAAAYYRDLAERLERRGIQGETARVCEKLGAALHMQARHADALAALEPAAASYEAAGELESLGRVTARIGHIHAERGTHGEGLPRVPPLIARLEARGPSRSLALLYLAQVALLTNTNLYSDALAPAGRAAHLARALGDAHLERQALLQQGYCLLGAGWADEARAALEAVLPLAEASGDLQCLSRALNLLAHVALHRADFPVSRHQIDRALALAERIGHTHYTAFELMHRGYILFRGGAWDLARADAERAARLCGEVGTFAVSGYPAMVLGFVCYAEGSWAEAAGHLERAVAVADSRAAEALLMASSVLAEIDLLEGHPEAARARVQALLDRFGSASGDDAYLLPKLAWSHLELGDVARAGTAAARAVAFAQRSGDFLNLVEALRVQALVLMAQRRWAEAERILAEILAETQRRHYPWGEARVLDTLGQLLARAGAREAARERLQAALAIFRRLGARKDSERAEQLLATLG